MHVFRVLIYRCNTIILLLIFLPSLDFPSSRCHNYGSYYIVINAITVLFPINISRCPLLSAILSHLFPTATILKSAAIKLLSQFRKQMAVVQHQVRAVCRIFHDSFVTKLYAMVTYFVTEISLCLACPSSTNTCVYSCFVLN